MMASVRYLDRKLVRNILRHTETHNRLQEETGMWRDRAKEVFKHDSRAPRRRGRDRDKSWQTVRTARMDQDDRWDYNPLDRTNWNDRQRNNRDIFRAEQGNQERWGHTGFMELYPEEFINKESMDEMSGEDGDVEGKKKTKKKRSRETHRKRKSEADKKKRKKEGKRTSHKRRKHRESSSSSSSDSNSDSDSSSSSSSSSESKKEAQSSRSRHLRTEREELGWERPTKRRRDRSPPSLDGRFHHDAKGQRLPTKKTDVEKKNREQESSEGRRRGKSPRRTDQKGDTDTHHKVRDRDRERRLSGAQSRDDRVPQGTRDSSRLHSRPTDVRASARDRKSCRSEKRPASPGKRSRHQEETEGTSGSRSRADGGRLDKSDRRRSPHSATRKEGRDRDQTSGKDRHTRRR